MNSSVQPSSLQILTTKDGSQTLLNSDLNSTYHSRHGALTESEHIFIHKGLEKVLEKGVTKVTLLEMGFGTGLNALLTALQAERQHISIDYHTLELYPVPQSVWMQYQLPPKLAQSRHLFEKLHQATWNTHAAISPQFTITKHHVSLLDFKPSTHFNLVYYDAFEPETQPQLWTQDVFERIFSWLQPAAVLATYCCKGYVRRNMLGAGFEVSKESGPPGKREIIVATKPL